MNPQYIDFYFDFSSPYSYIASEWIEALAARHGRPVQSVDVAAVQDALRSSGAVLSP